MDLLKSLALPQSTEHFHVLILIGALISVVLYPYLGFLLGSSFLSYIFDRKGIKEGKHQHVAFARSLIENVLANKTLPTFLALLPSFSLIFVFAQILQSTDAISVGLAAYGFILLAIGIVLLYTYKYTFRLGGILEKYEVLLKNQRTLGGLEDIQQYSRETNKSHFAAGLYGVILLGAASFLIISALSVATNPFMWTDIASVFDLLFCGDALIKILQFLAVSAGATGVGILYFFFAHEGAKKNVDEEYAAFVRGLALKLTVSSLLAQPILILMSVLLLPEASLSGLLYGVTGLSLIMLFVAAHFVYSFVQHHQTQHVSSAFYTLLSAVMIFSVTDHLAIHNATDANAVVLAYRYDQATEELKTRLGVATVVLTGEDIYNGRCSACHLFDEKKIGPAYKDVIPKYGGNKAKLMAFVLNPVKVNPAFPPMPNQGLKQAEADSIISYLIRRLGPAATKSAAPVQENPQK
jgi:cytochrome c